MNDRVLVEEWLEIARDDLDSAQYLFERPDRKPLEIICYHCQQAVEKFLKAYLCATDIDVPRTHEAELLCHRCYEINDGFAAFFDSCEEIETYATRTRYPNRIEVSIKDAKRALEQAESVGVYVADQIQQMIQDHEMGHDELTLR